MNPYEFTDPRNTVWKYDQCITANDLRLFIDLLLDEADAIPNDFIYEKERVLLAAKTVETLHDWIVTGKQRDFRGMI